MRRLKMARDYWIAIFLIAALIVLIWWLFFHHRAYTDDAYVEGNQVYITPLQSGFVTAIYTDDTFLVNRGQRLVELDKTDARLALATAEQLYSQAVRTVSQQFHTVFALRADIEIKKAELVKANQDYMHRLNVLEAEAVSVEDFEHATAALKANLFSLKMAEAMYDRAYAEVRGTTIANHPHVLQAAESVRLAWVKLYRCDIFAPVTGLTAQRKIQVGMWAEAGTALMSVIPLDQIWVNANFKETQIRKMRLGQKARLRSDLWKDEIIYHGTVQGLSGGAGNAFSLLPPQNLSGNWIKIVQRVPVRIALDTEELLRYPLRIGLSMEVTVELDDEGELIPTSNKDSPHYLTPIFEKEQIGDEARIHTLFEQNSDPALKSYQKHPLYLEKVTTEEEVKKATHSLQLDPVSILHPLCDLTKPLVAPWR